MFTIYSLVDPRDQKVRYVGMSEDVYSRFIQHIRGGSNSAQKNAWIGELRSLNLMVIMYCLEQVNDVDVARDREMYWIAHYLHLGAPLLNQHVPLLSRHKDLIASSVEPMRHFVPKGKRASAVVVEKEVIGSKKDQIITLKRSRSDLRTGEIAALAKVSEQYVRRVLKKIKK